MKFDRFMSVSHLAEIGGLDYKENRIRRCIHTAGKKASKSWEGGQQEVERGEGQTSRMRHASPQAVIHLHTGYAAASGNGIGKGDGMPTGSS